MIKCIKELKKNILLITMILGIFHCSTPQQKAEEFAFENACPKYGFFTQEEIEKLISAGSNTSSAFYFLNELEEKVGLVKPDVAIKTKDGRVIHKNSTALYSANTINTKKDFESYQKDLKDICGNDVQAFAKTKYELIEDSKLEVEKIKQSTAWTKAFKDSAEFNLGEAGDQLKLAYFNSKDHDYLNKISYSSDPSEESKDRKNWVDIKRKKYIIISKDNSEKNSYFFTKDYNFNNKTYPIYFEQGVTFGRSGMISGDGLYIPRFLSEDISIPMTPELATSIKNGTIYDLDVIFTLKLVEKEYSYYYVNDSGLEIVLNEEKANLIRTADPYVYRSLSKRSGNGRIIELKPLYFIFSIPSENIIITNVK